MSEYAPKPSGNVINYYSGNTNRTINNNSGFWKSLSIANDGSESLYFIVNGITIEVKQNEQFEDDFEQFNQIQIITTENYRLVLRR